MILIALGVGVQNIMDAIYWYPFLFPIPVGDEVSKYNESDIMNPLVFLQGFKIIFRDILIPPPICIFNWRGGLNYMSAKYWTNLLFPIFIVEGVQNIMAARYFFEPLLQSELKIGSTNQGHVILKIIMALFFFFFNSVWMFSL